ncbi:RNA methyltransferase, RsmE family [Gemella bergeri ATCC 700627]|uniref:Ribosomal RNA small subunit methyltransferase E n=1 Tax=Gemella bergeri ATCC 700627 TaxID=1321820 RepID=U2S375_9BACL|nr:RsmE family RNA methyltransferase [Gemella bergeri]ERK60168.1 RNA methyltransferase, RsmE family [Gemella bergeri ATCC 700627]
MQQYFVDELFDEYGRYTLSKDDSNHIVRIMRKKENDKVYIVFKEKIKYICNIIDSKIDGVVVEPFERIYTSNELTVEITVAIPPLKSDKIEYLIQKLTELGVTNIVLFNSERNIAKIKKDKIENKIQRWEKIIKEAAEQSKRNLIPNIIYVDSLQELISYGKNMDYKVVAYEKESTNIDNINLKNLLCSDLNKKSILAVFGSEGGLSENEISNFRNADYKTIGLGKRILRAETAPLYLVSCVSYFNEFYN